MQPPQWGPTADGALLSAITAKAQQYYSVSGCLHWSKRNFVLLGSERCSHRHLWWWRLVPYVLLCEDRQTEGGGQETHRSDKAVSDPLMTSVKLCSGQDQNKYHLVRRAEQTPVPASLSGSFVRAGLQAGSRWVISSFLPPSFSSSSPSPPPPSQSSALERLTGALLAETCSA